MREIKFRAWDKLQNKMYQNAGISMSGIQIYTNITSFPDTIILDMGKDCFELMQYTGMKDKQDVEIYEGDILLVDDVIMYVKYEDNSFCTFRKNGTFGSLQLFTNSSKVIGNIYEHPHLLHVNN